MYLKNDSRRLAWLSNCCCKAGGVTMGRAELADTTDPSLTERQRKILDAIEESMQRCGYPPTLREIGETAGLASTSSVSHQLATLEKKGYLSRGGPGRPRTAVLRPLAGPDLEPGPGPEPGPDPGPEPGPDFPEPAGHPGSDIDAATVARVPVVGRIAAGVPILSQELFEDMFPLPRQLVGDGELIVLKVVGDSMINAAIADGDWVVVRRETDVENGDIVAATIDGVEVEGTVKTLKRSDGHVWLMPHNPAYAPILGDDAVIAGKVVAVLRRV
jgi:repressor LexA